VARLGSARIRHRPGLTGPVPNSTLGHEPVDWRQWLHSAMVGVCPEPGTVSEDGSVPLALSTAQRPATIRRSSLVWQRTGTVGTELVLGDGTAPSVVTGNAVVGGPQPHATRWHADLDAGWRVRALTITCEGDGWRRNLALSRAGDGWTCGAEQSGAPDGPPAGIDDPARLAGVDMVLLADSPIFLSWAMRQLRTTPESGPVTVRAARVRLPWLTVVPGPATFQLVGEQRLRVAGDGPVATYDLDADGIVTYQPGRLRITQ
jgi:hypothetical protein